MPRAHIFRLTTTSSSPMLSFFLVLFAPNTIDTTTITTTNVRKMLTARWMRMSTVFGGQHYFARALAREQDAGEDVRIHIDGGGA